MYSGISSKCVSLLHFLFSGGTHYAFNVDFTGIYSPKTRRVRFCKLPPKDGADSATLHTVHSFLQMRVCACFDSLLPLHAPRPTSPAGVSAKLNLLQQSLSVPTARQRLSHLSYPLLSPSLTRLPSLARSLSVRSVSRSSSSGSPRRSGIAQI